MNEVKEVKKVEETKEVKEVKAVKEVKDITKMNIFEKMSIVRRETGIVAKNIKVEFGAKYNAVGEADVMKAVNDAEDKARLYSYLYSLDIIHEGNIQGSNNKASLWIRFKAIVRVVNIDNPNEFIDFIGYGDGIDNGDKACGKGATYAVKYALLKGYKIPTGEDDPDYMASVGDAVELISDKQKKEIQSFNVNTSKLLALYKVKSLDKLTYAQAEAALKICKEKQAKEQEKESAKAKTQAEVQGGNN